MLENTEKLTVLKKNLSKTKIKHYYLDSETMSFPSMSLKNLDEISKVLQENSFLIKYPNNILNVSDNPDNSKWDFSKGIWKDYLSIHESRQFSKPLYIFGYGSLLWNVAPELKSCKVHKVFVKGYRRRFWQLSTDHRGTIEFPGLVCSLISDEEYEELTGFYCKERSICYGLAFQVDEGKEEEVIHALDYREKGGYRRNLIQMFDSNDGQIREGIVYRGEIINNPHFLPRDKRDNIIECSRIISKSQGESGKNSEYLLNLNNFLKLNAYKDDYIFLLSELVKIINQQGSMDDISKFINFEKFKFEISINFSRNNDGNIYLCIFNISDTIYIEDFYKWLGCKYNLIDFSLKICQKNLKKGIELIISSKESQRDENTISISSLLEDFCICLQS